MRVTSMPRKTMADRRREAFKDIKYEEDKDLGISYSRWAPAFYQKAWNSAIEYKPDTNGEMKEVAAVQVQLEYRVQRCNRFLPDRQGLLPERRGGS